MKRLLSASIIAILATGAAQAGSLTPVPADPAPTVPVTIAAATDWSGFYLGALGGFQQGDMTTVGPIFDVDATTYGGFVGYSFQSGNIVYGAEVSAQMGDATVNGLAFDFDYLVDVRARVGYAFDNVLVYAAGGYSMGQIDRTGPLDMSGWNAGAGLEVALTDNLFLGGEYIYRDMSHTGITPFDYQTHAVQVRLGYRF